ncbi:MAG TPA: deoxyribodipyrimidine photo-lyase [Candidatus Absconditabacterales bacterium]|nr:deoxyribodipyrimidine photo-lyase [Candidatus Absconditabacterales bacterium]HNG97051.1 deoxyribodipyrimidine photo-lyase [Candidatus Absconditabacterales bacterium]
MSTTLFRFRQDLRLIDNTGLIETIKKCLYLVPVFIFDTDTLSQFDQPDTRMSFLIDSIIHLEDQLRSYGHTLIIRVGSARQIIPAIITEYKCDTLSYNRSYGLGSLQRDKELKQRCHEQHIHHDVYDDYLLVEPHMIPARKVFTPFFKLRSSITKSPLSMHHNFGIKQYDTLKSIHDRPSIKQMYNYNTQSRRPIDGWKTRLNHDMSNYTTSRNQLDHDGTTQLSVYIRFGLVSIRQVYRNFFYRNTPGDQTIISELAWREFWHHIMYHFPETWLTSFQSKRRSIVRQHNPHLLEARKTGQTGYPIIDAAMIQLKQENWMHNRARMIVASFLTKDLLIDRVQGEKHFSNLLLDYDACVNIGNRQRSASVGADPKPLRIFSPILQAQRFDPQAHYIKTYLPQLSHIPAHQLHDPLTYTLDYIPPIVDHVEMSKKAKEMYRGEHSHSIL